MGLDDENGNGNGKVKVISGKTPVTLTISSWWQVSAVIVVLVSIYFTLGARIEETIRIASEAQDRGKTLEKAVFELQMNQTRMSDDLHYFREQHDRDMKQLRELVK